MRLAHDVIRSHCRLIRLLGLASAFTLAKFWPAVARQSLPVRPEPPPNPAYEYHPGSFDGIGKWFLGREIAHYMSHEGAMWLEREERLEEERPHELMRLLELRPGQTVADIGAGSGYFSWRLASHVGPAGKVFATDIQPEMLGILRTNMQARGFTNIIPVLGSATNVNLPANSLDLALLVDVYHECDHPKEIIASLCQALKPAGRLVLVEYRGEEKWVPIKPLHKMTAAQVELEMAIHPLRRRQHLHLPRQHVLVFGLEPSSPNAAAPAAPEK